MRIVFQRVEHASVHVDGQEIGAIGPGALIFVGVREGDTAADALWCANRVAHLRVFEDTAGKLNHSLVDAGGACLVVSQFTLYGDCTKGRRPGFSRACAPEEAEQLYLQVADALRALGIHVATGKFRADMKVSLLNDGPVTLLFDSEKTF